MKLEDKLRECSVEQLKQILFELQKRLDKIKLENKEKELMLED